MAASGFFPSLSRTGLFRTGVIYTKPSTSPTTSTSIPVNRVPVTQPTVYGTRPPLPSQPTSGGLTTPTGVNPVNVDPTTNEPQTVTHLGGTDTGGTGTPIDINDTSGPIGTQTGGGGGGGGGTDTSRLIDLLASAFQPQDIQQGYAPQSVSSDALTPGSGTNPMAVVVLAILVMAGIYFYTQHKKKGAA